MTPGLHLSGVSLQRLGSPVVRDVNLAAPRGAITALLGANGAGKTTLLEGVSGVSPLASGTIELDGQELSRKSRRARASAGIAHVEQNRTVFRTLTVEQNLRVPPAAEGADLAFETFPELAARRDVPAGLLSGGEQQMLVIARALATRPAVLLIDELSLGLGPKVVQRLADHLVESARDGLGVLLVEQFASLALSISLEAYVMTRGEIVFAGPATKLAAEPDLLRQAYLGKEGDGPGDAA